MKEIIRKAKAGDQQAFAELYTISSGRAYFKAKRYLSNDTDVEEVLQDSYISVYKNLDRFDEKRSFGAWLDKIVSNKCIDYLRKHRPDRLDVAMGDDGVELLVDESAFLSEEYLQETERRQVVLDIIDRLPDVQRLVILLHYFDDMSVKDIAEVTETAEATVRVNLFKGRKKIKEEVLQEERRGVKLYGVAVFAFPAIKDILTAESAHATIPTELSKVVLEGTLSSIGAVAAAASASTTSGGAAMTLGAKIGALSTSVKAVIGIGAAVIIVGTGAILLRPEQHGQDELPIEESIVEEKAQQVSEPEPSEIDEPSEPDENEDDIVDEEVTDDEVSEAEVSTAPDEPLMESSVEAAQTAAAYQKITLNPIPFFPAYDAISLLNGAVDMTGRTDYNTSALAGSIDVSQIPERLHIYKNNLGAEDSLDRVVAFYRQELSGYSESAYGAGYIVTGMAGGYYIELTITPSGSGAQLYLEASQTPSGNVVKLEDIQDEL